jgi:uncharacterized RDD family membrane protein YckC
MQTIRITTPQNIDIDYEIGGLGERIIARLIDYAVYIAIIIFCIIIASITNLWHTGILIGILVIFALLYVFYDLICEVFMNGQSIGKRVMKIKVISLDGGQATLGQYLLRWVFRIVDFSLTLGLGALITAAVGEKCQRIGDLVAGTALIKTSPRTPIDSLAFSPVIEGYAPVFNSVTQLSDKDIVLIHEVVSSYIQSGNSVIVYNTAQQIKKVLSINTPPEMDDMLFLQTLIKDYNHIAAEVV